MNQFQNQMYQSAQTNPYANRFNSYYPTTIPQNNEIKWVQGIEGAKAYQLPPNSNVQLMDSENDSRFYIKVSDNVGMCTLRIFEYKEITEQNTKHTVDMSEYVKKSELEALVNKLLGGEDEQSVSTVNPSVITK